MRMHTPEAKGKAREKAKEKADAKEKAKVAAATIVDKMDTWPETALTGEEDKTRGRHCHLFTEENKLHDTSLLSVGVAVVKQQITEMDLTEAYQELQRP